MKKVLLALIVSFLIFLNVRLWAAREAEFLLSGPCRRSTCDMPYGVDDVLSATTPADAVIPPPSEAVPGVTLADLHSIADDIRDLKNQMRNCQSCAGQAQSTQLRLCLAQAATYLKRKPPKQDREEVAIAIKVDEPSEQQSHVDDYILPSLEFVQESVERGLAEFLEKASCNELALQQLLELINNELKLVEVLIYPTIGNRFSLLSVRDELLDRAIPSVRILYDRILSLATHNDILNNQFVSQRQFDQGIRLSLSAYDKKLFLHSVYQRLSDILQQLQSMQYRLVFNSPKHRA